ncbi:hypothetical protein Ancab_008390 [Ancistrocladus abbreviatus]
MGCMTDCISVEDLVNNTCDGIGCCETSIPEGVSNITTEVFSYHNHAKVVTFNPCSSAAVVANDAFVLSVAKISTTAEEYRSSPRVPVVLNWTIGSKSCHAAETDQTLLCKEHSNCTDPPGEVGCRCQCWTGYDGNPYITPGCQDIDECSVPELNHCKKPATCKNTNGSYKCKCPPGLRGTGTISDPCVPTIWLTVIIAVAGVTVVVGGGFWLYLVYEKKKQMNMRQQFFQQNGGLILNEELARLDASAHKFSVFNPKELERATNNYSKSNIVGKGGFGEVYKGILPDGQVIAIKKSLKFDPSQTEQFAKEVIVLSKINHMNVVKLLGCCLEMVVPVLVYEFISNGTLRDHLTNDAKASRLTWEKRLSIATEVASVLSHLHTKASPPILHRDMKSTNILLLDNYTDKVADFGCSKLVVKDPSQFERMIPGTYGYIDPEVVVIGALTEKSDVYSFGVVLLELLTRKNPRHLASHFLQNFDNHLFEILDEKIVSEQTTKQLKAVAHVARACLSMKGEERPTMREVEHELEGIWRLGMPYPWSFYEPDALQNQEEREHLLHITLEENGGDSTSNTTTMNQSLNIESQPLGGR